MQQRMVRLRQGLWCEAGKHVLQQGDTYYVTEHGNICCPQHQEMPLPETQLAGAHE